MRNSILMVIATVGATIGLMGLTACQKKNPLPDDLVQGSGGLTHTQEFKEKGMHGAAFLKDRKVCEKCHGPSIPVISPTGRAEPAFCSKCHEAYPHVGDTKKTHGRVYLQDAAKCYLCHERRSKETAAQSPKGVPGCLSCHDGFPHPADFKQKTQHGTQSLKDRANCAVCHKLDSPARGAGAPGCLSCHSSYPHPANIGDQSVHGPLAVANQASCTGCHPAFGQQYEPSKEAPGCRSCHEGFPHPQQFGQKEQHGTLALGANRSSCLGCHDKMSQDKNHGRDAPGCASCHTVFPHVDNIGEKQVHGPLAIANRNSCTGCHPVAGKEYEPSKAAPGCMACHEGFPHPQHFGKKEGHGAVARGDRKNACLSCHDKFSPDKNPGKGAPGCTSCHQSFPHVDTIGEKEVHGPLATAKNRKDCLRCHDEFGSEYDVDKATPGCSACHTGFPHVPGFGKKQLHGAPAMKDRASCTGCHAETSTDPNTGKGAPGCASCHKGFPHGAEFKKPGVHGGLYTERPKQCLGCHQELGTSPNTGVAAPGCSACHKSYPHTPGFGEGSVHGPALLKFGNDPKSACSVCHGAAYPGSSAPSCKDCHSAQHPVKFKVTKEHGREFLKSTQAMGDCLKCHGLKGENGKRSCAMCHESYPHPDRYSQSEQHGEDYRKNPQDCARCHGENFTGDGKYVASCKKCHEYPHSPTFAKAGEHGQAFLAEWNGTANGGNPVQVSCKVCHTSQPLVQQVSCSSCHIWHLQDGLKPHADKSRRPESACYSCHTDGKALLPNLSKGCMGCHTRRPLRAIWGPPANPGNPGAGMPGPTW